MNDDIIKFYLRHYLNTVSDSSIELFKSKTQFKKFKKGDIVIHYGKPTSKFYIIQKGLVGSFITNNEGSEFIRTLYTEKKAFGALSSLIKKGFGSNAYYECLSDCEVFEANCKDFEELKKISDEFVLIYNKILEDVYLRLEKKVDELSLLNATQRYLLLKEEIPNIFDLLPQYQIASYLKITFVQLSRIRKKLLSHEHA